MFAAIWIAKFSLQATLRWRGELRGRAAAVVDETSSKGVVVEATPAAEAKGVLPGMPSTQAMARCPDLKILPRSKAEETSADAVLLDVASECSPEVEQTRRGVCTLDLRSAPKSACWQKLGESIVERLEGFGLYATVGVAGNPDLALLAARRADPVSIVYNAPEFLGPLPVEALEPPEEMSTVLRDWGVACVADLTRLPRQEAIERLGPDAETLWLRASGRSRRLLRLVRTAEIYVEAFDFEHEIETTEPLLFLLRRFLDSLCARLGGVHRVAAGMTLRLPLEDSTCYEREFTIPSPTADADALFRILSTHLECLQLPQRPTGVQLQIAPANPRADQLRLFESALRDPNRFGETLARLAALAGNDRIGVPEPNNTHQPDRFQMTAPDFANMSGATASELAASPILGLPLRRFRPPLSARVSLDRERPTRVEAASIRADISACAGPYRRSGGWWDDDRWAIEEWDVELHNGSLYRLARTGDGDWNVEGVYDESEVKR